MRQIVQRLPVLILLALMSCLFLARGVLATETTIALPKINEIYPNAPGSSELGFEFIELFNPGTTDIDLSAFQLQIKDKPKSMQLSGILSAGGYKAIATTFALVNSGDSIQLAQLQSDEWAVLEEVVYGSGALETQSWSYYPEGWELSLTSKDLINQRIVEPPVVDVCPATSDIDSVVPEGYEIDENGECVLMPILCLNDVVVSEFLSDPIGLEADGGEFIELYNPGPLPVSLLGCHLITSKSSADVVTFGENDVIAANGFFVTNLADRLTNTSGSISFITQSREDVVNYDSLHEGEAFAIFGSDWKITQKETPGQANEFLVSVEEDSDEPELTIQQATLVACSAGKYRNPETNRCRNILVDSVELQACEPGQYRSPETNRCRKFTTASATLAACDIGQERNPTTNRCRKIVSSTDGAKPCAEGYERNTETNRCRKIVLAKGALASTSTEAPTRSKIDARIIYVVMALALGYGVYEYKHDLYNFYLSLKARIGSG